MDYMGGLAGLGGLLSMRAHIDGMLPRSEIVRVGSCFITKKC